MRLNGKVALVSGASRGIGAAIARAFAREGCSVVVNYSRSAEPAREVVRSIVDEGGAPSRCRVMSPTFRSMIF